MEAEAPGLLFSVVTFLVAITVLVFVHEMGHYLVARWCRVKVDVFSIGFGKELYGWNDKNGTRWRISAVPLGGYVKFYGDASGASNADDEKLEAMNEVDKEVSFHHKSLLAKSAIVFAGPFINLLFAALIFAGIVYSDGKRIISSEVGATSVELAEAGLMPGDIITEIEGRDVSRFSEVREVASFYPDQEIELVVERGGITRSLTVSTSSRLAADRWDNEYKLGDLAIAPVARDPEVGQMVRDSAAHTYGLEYGDYILAVDGTAISTFDDLRALITPKPNQEVILTIDREDNIIELPIIIGERDVTASDGTVSKEGVLGIYPAYGEVVEFGIFAALMEGVRDTDRTLRNMVTTIGQLILGVRSITELSGPVGIATMVGDVAVLGIVPFLTLIALLSVNLGFVNLLPIPMLDGGHLMFYGLEAVNRGPLPKRAQELAFLGGFVFVLGLMIFLTLNDLHKIVL